MPYSCALAAVLWAVARLVPSCAASPFTEPPRNLALDAKATASESFEGFAPELARDGDPRSRWSAIPGHNRGVWFELDWPGPQRVGEVIIHQFDRFVEELDVQSWDEGAGDWRTVQHMGAAGRRLPGAVVCRFAPIRTARLRIGNITNGPSFTEVEVYAEPFSGGVTTRVASDLRGNLIGVVTDAFGTSGIRGAQVTLAGRVAHGVGGPAPWGASAASDENGLFSVALPLGLTGPLSVSAAVEGTVARADADACEFQCGLTPRGGAPGPEVVPGPWKFGPDPPEGFERPDFDDSGWSPIDVPAHWEMQGFHPIDGVGGYRAVLRVGAGTGRLKLAFDGVYSGAQVWVNGRRVAAHEGGATPFECDITDAVYEGENVLAVRVAEHATTSDLLDQMSSYADFPLGGIMRRVWLLRVPAVHAGSLWLRTDVDEGSRDATLTGSVCVLNESDGAVRAGTLRLRLADPSGGVVDLGAAPIEFRAGPWERADVPFSVHVPRARAWDAEHPNLYTLTVEVRDEGAVVQSVAQRIGFRQTSVRGPQLLINGRPVKLRGTCHHDSHPLMGRAVTPELTRRDLALMKGANLNALRTSHYPPIPELLDIADELGIYVEDEASFCWVGVSDDLRNAPRILQLTAELVARDRNHPSVCLWSLCNESGFGRDFELSRDWVHAADPSRPLSAATSATVDLATMHNPITVAGIDAHEGLDRPLLFDESFAPFQGIFGDGEEMWLDPGLRDYYVEPLTAVYDRLMRSRVTHGSMIWAWSDDLFCVPGRGLEYGRGGTRVHFVEESYAIPGRGVCGDAPWGLVDGWRRPKPEYWHVRKMHSPVRVSERPLALPSGAGALRVPVENQYDFADLNEMKIEWRIGDEGGLGVPVGRPGGGQGASIPAHSTGEVRITARSTPAPGQVLELWFTDASGAEIDRFRVPLGEERAEGPPGTPVGGAPLVIRDEHTLAGNAARIIGRGFEIAIDRDTGRLRRCVGAGEPVLVELPSVHVLPTARATAALPDRTTWRPEGVSVQAEGQNARVRIAGRYDRFAGEFGLVITPDGEVSVHSSFTYTGPEVWAREIGTRLAAARACDRLAWSRVAEWGVYPDDHIGRPVGAARALADHPAGVPPTWPWAQDNSPLGCNDFRSTKRRILWASLTGPGGAGVQVLSDGRQHVRATLEPDRVALCVNDTYSGTGSGLNEWQQNYGRGRLVKSGEVLEATVRLRLAGPAR